MTPIYLDAAATTPVHPDIVSAINDVLLTNFGNPSSRHRLGLLAEQTLREARAQVAAALYTDPNRIIFTSGGTESVALAILGTLGKPKSRRHVLIGIIEHAAVFETSERLTHVGYDVETIPVTRGGWIDPHAVATRLRPETAFVAVMYVNNETGVIQPIADIGRIIKTHHPDCAFLVDGAQAHPLLPFDFQSQGVDLFTLSAHKLRGPKGVGCLALSKQRKITPLWGGGGQEEQRRTGTQNMAGIVGFARALQLPRVPSDLVRHQLHQLASIFLSTIPGAYLVGDEHRRAPHILSIALPRRPSDVVVNALSDAHIYVSSGSACHSRKQTQSRVFKAMELPETDGVVRLSLCEPLTAPMLEQAQTQLQVTLSKLGAR